MKILLEPAPSNGKTTAITAEGAPWFGADYPTSMPAYVHRYAEHGLALVAIEPGSKAPKARGWQKTQPQSPDDAVAAFARRAGWGCGAVLGNSSPALAVIDIDDLPAAVELFQAHGIDLEALLADPATPRTEGRPGRAKLWYLAPAGLTTRKVASGAVELRAGAVQDVLPPSIHPDTGQPYRWVRPPRGPAGFPPLPAAIEAVWRAEQEPQRQAQTRTQQPHNANRKGGTNVEGRAWDTLRQQVCRRLGGAAEVLAKYGVTVGGDGKALSPFRSERHPSLQVHPDGRWTDFGGPATRGTTDPQGNGAGDAIDLEAHYRNLTAAETTVQLAREYSIPLPAGKQPQWLGPAAAHGSEPPDYGEVPPPTDDEAGAASTGKESQADGMVRLAIAAQAANVLALFTDAAGVPYAQVQMPATEGASAHPEVHRLNSSGFKRWLSRQLYLDTGRPGNADAVKTALLLLESFAGDGPRHELHNRVAWHQDALYYDLTDTAHRAAQITADGWTIGPTPRPLFMRLAHQQPQVEPLRGGDVRRVFDYISIDDPDHQLLLMTWLLAAYVPGWPHPMPVLRGPQGSGKSYAFRVLRRLIDPSQTPTANFPRDLESLIQALSHSWFSPFDNVTALQEWVSDALCRAVTGDGFTKRQLFTDDEDIIYSFQRVVGLNGITIAGMRPDLTDRCITIELARIAPDRRRRERDMRAAFERDLPGILGGVFDALVLALRYLPEVDLRESPRMADFAEFGCAAARALGHTEADFLRAYGAIQERQTDDAIDADPVASAVAALMAKTPTYEGTPAEVLARLVAEAREIGVDTDAKGWPTEPRLLTRALKRAEATLMDKGISFELARSKTARSMRIYRRTPPGGSER